MMRACGELLEQPGGDSSDDGAMIQWTETKNDDPHAAVVDQCSQFAKYLWDWGWLCPQSGQFICELI